MDRQVEVRIRGSHLTKDSNLAGVRGEANATVLRIDFDARWDGLAKKVTFWDARGQNPVERTLTADMLEDIVRSAHIYLCPIPGEAMTEAGKMTFVVDGWKEGKRYRSVSDNLTVQYAPLVDQADQPVDPTPTQAERLQQQIDNMLDGMRDQAVRAENAASGSEAARDAAVEAKSAAETAVVAAESARDKTAEAQVAAEGAQVKAEDAQNAAEAAQAMAENAVVHAPYINKDSKTWMVWSFVEGRYKDTGVKAEGRDGKDAEQQPVSANFYTADRDELEATFGTQDITLSDTYFDEGATRVLDIPLNEVNAEYIYNLYDELLGIEKENRTPVKDADGNPILGDDGEPVAYEYVISTGEYNTAGERGDRDTDIKKPKYLVLNCIHGNEKAAALSAYWFFKDVVERKNVPSQFREGAEFHIIPVGNKAGANKNKRYNGTKTGVTYNGVEIGVDLNRNFDYEWSSEVVRDRYPGKYAGSEIETQAIMSWLKANSDAELFIDFHNSSSDGRDENDKTIWVTNEVAMVVGLNTEKMKEVKRTALRGLDRVIPFWRYDRQYTEHNLTHPPGNKNEPWGDPNMKAPVFSYSSFYEIPGASVYYATDKLDLPSITLECSILQNADLSDMRTKYPFTPETIAAGAEALGNILLEFYERSGGENHGKEGQFAVADGIGGVKWENQEKIFNDFLISLMSTPYAKYSTIENALAETNATADGKIGAYTDKHGVYQIVLLNDISSAVPIEVTRGCNIQLNGHTISFTVSGAYLYVKTEEKVSIDGTAVGSKIVASGITSSADEQVIKAGNASNPAIDANLTIIGGTYALENVNCKNGRVIRSGNTTTQIDMNGCAVRAVGTGTGTLMGGTFGVSKLINCTFIVEAVNTKVQGVSAYANVAMTNCTANVKTTGQGYTAVGAKANTSSTLTVVNCNITADGYGDGMVAAIADGVGATVNIIGGHYKAARDALSISNNAKIDGGIFEGCRYGGGWLTGDDIKVKDATFRNIPYFGDLEWNHERYSDCRLSGSDGLNAVFDHCNFGADGTEVGYGLKAEGTGTNVYISNSVIDDVFTYDLSADAGNYIYVGKNVAYRQDKVQGSIDTTTYAGQSFAW